MTTVTDNDRYHFTTSDCHVLALAVHELTGWQLATTGPCDEGGHCFVVTPSGKALDVTGVQDIPDLLYRWCETEWTPYDADQSGGPSEDSAPARAAELAPLLVAATLREDNLCS